MAFPADLIGKWQAADANFGTLSILVDSNGVVTGTWKGLVIPTQGGSTKAPDLPLTFGRAMYSPGDDHPPGGAAYITVTTTGGVASGTATLKFYITMSGFREVGNTTETLTGGVLMVRDVPGHAHDVSPKIVAWKRTSTNPL